MIRKSICVFITLIMILSTPIISNAEVVDSGTCGDNLTWELDDAGTLTISGIGDMLDYNYTVVNTSSGYYYYADTPWYDSRYSINEVIIDEGVTHISNCAFWDCAFLDTIIMADSVIDIGTNAFWDCRSLKNVEFGNNTLSIGNNAFYNCWSLSDIVLPDELTDIGIGAFAYCEDIETITIPYKVTSIKSNTFWGCEKLQSIVFPVNLNVIGASAFYNCNALTSVYYSGTEEQWEEIEIENDNECLINADISCEYKNVTTLYSGVCGASGDNLTWMLDVEGTLTIHGVGDMADYSSASSPWYSYRDSIENIIINDGVTSIGDYAFSGCAGLLSLTIPNSVTSIGKLSISGCSCLSNVTIPISVNSIDTAAFSGCDGLDAVYITDLASWCELSFEYYTSNPLYYAGNLYINNIIATNITIPSGVKGIGDYVFEGCTSLTDVTILNGTTSIGEKTFEGCSNLTNIIIPEGVTTIDKWAFHNCSNLTKITIPNSITSINSNVFYNCSQLINITLPYNLTKIGTQAFYGCTNLTNISIPEHVTNIGAYAFCGCTNLTEMIIPDSVAIIDSNAFNNCTNLTSVDIGNGVTSIGMRAFYSCTNLTSIDLGNRIESIGIQAFCKCENLTNIKIPDSVTNIESSIFHQCRKLIDIEVAENNQYYCSIDGNLFNKEKTTLIQYAIGKTDAQYTIPENVIYLEAGAFEGCASLINLSIPNSITTIGNLAFYNCSALTNVYYMGSSNQWDEISIGSDNECLTGAKILFAEDISTPTPEIDRDKTYRFLTDTYSFANERRSFGYSGLNIKIPLQRFVTVFGEAEGQTMYEYDSHAYSQWYGSCFGMSATSLALFNNDLTILDYDDNADSIYDIKAPQSKMSDLTRVIECFHISQYTATVAAERAINESSAGNGWRKLGDLISATENFVKTGENGIIISAWGTQGSGHAVVPVDIENDNNGDYIITVYDNNHPDETNIIRINAALEGFEYGEYGYSGRISFNYASTVYALLEDSVELMASSQEYLRILVNSEDVEIIDKSGVNVCDNENAYKITGVDAQKSNLTQFLVPYNEYVIQNHDASIKNLKVSVSNSKSSKSADIPNANATVTVGVDNVTDCTYIYVNTDTDEDINVLAVNAQGLRTTVKASSTYLGVSDEKGTFDVASSESSILVNGANTALTVGKLSSSLVVGNNVGVIALPIASTDSSSDEKQEDTADFNSSIQENLMTSSNNIVSGDLKIKINNNTNKSTTADLMVAVYSENGTLQGTVTQEVILGTNANYIDLENLNFRVNDNSQYFIKCFIWDTLDSMRPLTKALEVDVK